VVTEDRDNQGFLRTLSLRGEEKGIEEKGREV